MLGFRGEGLWCSSVGQRFFFVVEIRGVLRCAWLVERHSVVTQCHMETTHAGHIYVRAFGIRKMIVVLTQIRYVISCEGARDDRRLHADLEQCKTAA